MIVPESIEDPMDAVRFPPDAWRLVEKFPSANDLGLTETLFATANGYLGMRATPTEGRPAYKTGTFINGFHETWEIKHAENAFGFAKTGQTIVNAPSSHIMKLYVDDEPLLVSSADLQEYERSIDFRDGILRRDLTWRTPSGKRVRVRTTRMVSLADRHLALFTLEITMLAGNAPIVVSSQIVNQEDFDAFSQTDHDKVGMKDPRRNQGMDHRVLNCKMHWCSPKRMILGYQVANSKMTLGVGADHFIDTRNDFEELDDTSEDLGRKIYRISAKQGEPIKITKAVAYHTADRVPVRELSDRVRRTLDRVQVDGFSALVESHKRVLEGFWERSDVSIGAETRVQQAMRWCLFQLVQASARADGIGIPAKGLTGDGYEGHYFWDSEVYVIPFLAYTNPVWARNALRFRYSSLEQARERARELSTCGALFPWRTINGEEASAYYAAGTAQYHIDADIAYAVGQYWFITGDTEFMYGEGAEMLVETARMWAELGFWRVAESGQVFEIHGVTGPDEYTTVVNNNMYTNVMARHNLRLACRIVEVMKEEAPQAYEKLVHDVDLRDEEVAEWQACAKGMKIPFDEHLGIHPQDDVFIEKELWDIENTPKERFPLLLHYHPLVIYRFQVLKQADVVLALFLLADEFTADQKRADFEYYDPITTGDSSLSVVVQSIVAAQVGHQDMAYQYFHSGLYVDLGDLHNNTCDGVHIASAGGVWHSVIHGFAGMSQNEEILEFDPRLPRQWTHIDFRVRSGQTCLRIHLTKNELQFCIEEGPAISVRVRGKEYSVTEDAPTVVRLSGQGLRLPNLGTSHPIIGGLRHDGTVITAEVPELTESIPSIE